MADNFQNNLSAGGNNGNNDERGIFYWKVWIFWAFSAVIVVVLILLLVLVYVAKNRTNKSTVLPTKQRQVVVLPKNFPVALDIGEQAGLVTATEGQNGSTVIFMSRQQLGDLVNKFTSSLSAKGWKILYTDKNSDSVLILASPGNKNNFEKSLRAEISLNKFPNNYTEIRIKYGK